MEAARSACCIRHKGKAKARVGTGESPVPAASGAVFKWNRLLTTGNLCIRGLQTRNLFCIIIGRVTRFGLKLVAALLLCSAVLLGSQMLLPSAAATSAIPAGCHNHGQPVRAPASHQCCAVGHSPSILRANPFVRDLCAFPSYVVAETKGGRSREPLFFSTSPSSSSLRTPTRLRV